MEIPDFAFVEMAMTVVDPDSDNLVPNDLRENDIEIVVIIQIADGDVQCAMRRLKMKELRLLPRKMQFDGVVIPVGTITNAIGNCEIRLLVCIKIRNCRRPSEGSGSRTQTKTPGIAFRSGSSRVRQKEEDSEHNTDHYFRSDRQANFSSCEQTINNRQYEQREQSG